MIRKKVCMLGAFAVGKTSLVSRFVKQLYSDRYETTIGVKILKKTLAVDERDVSMLLWDIHGDDEFQSIDRAYLRGASGLVLVVDGTRGWTLQKALELRAMATAELGNAAFVTMLNKHDLASDWELDEAALSELRGSHGHVVETSAKTGAGVEEAFRSLAGDMVRG